MSDLTKEIQYIKGVGPNRVKLLNNLNIFTLKDLITYYPRDYEDRSKPVKIEDLEDGKEALIAAIPVAKMNETRIRNRKMVIYKLIVEDETGRAILTWYNQSYLKNRFKVGEIYHFFGKVKKVQNRIEMLSPVFDEETKNKNTGKIIPIYPLTYNLSQNVLRGIIENAITLVNNKLPETLPKYILDDYKLLGANEAIKKIHFPENFEEFEKARKRLVFEELLGMQLALLNLKNAYESDNNGIQFSKDVKMSDVINTLPFNNLNIFTLKDLITYYPRDYEDRSKPVKIEDLEDGKEALIAAIPVAKMNETRIRNRKMVIYKLIVEDETGRAILTWYNQSYLKNRFKVGEIYHFFGKVKKVQNRIEMLSPVFDEETKNKNTGKIIPIYPLTYNLSQNVLRGIIENAITLVNNKLPETLPKYILDDYKLLGANEAIKKIHFPENFEEFEKARKRLVFEELLGMQLALLNLKNAYESDNNGIQFSKDVKMSDVINTLPFKLTKAQLRVLEEIDKDMESDKNMNRLLQGDVGSGKTAVSIIASYKAVKCGYQVAIMAPTAILASQHLESFKEMLDKFGITCELLVSSITKKKKEEILERLRDGKIDILIGTHALLEENVIFNKLGLVVTDEQHRFGVKQRTTIVEKGQNPDVLVMTATPIPRTLALILYGDLDISIIDELPPNRKKIDTFAVTKGMEERVNNFIRKQVDEGRQAYIVCPLVEENEELNLKSVTELAEKYKNEVFKEYKVEYLHGKMKNKEKDEIMERFKNGEIDILISTTVIEVGVNVPNASLMVVENAERFGLAQLHQLRGRVGRGEYKSYCVLKYQGNSDVIRKRMKVMTDTNDGFVISEKDLELRGSGEFFGTRQHGLPEFKIANLFEDMPILKQVQALSVKITEEDRKLELDKNKELRLLIEEKFQNRVEI